MKEHFMIGFDLGNEVSQISYLSEEEDTPSTVSPGNGAGEYSFPTVLYKRKGYNLWYFAKEALRQDPKEGFLVQNLISKAKSREPVEVDGEAFDPVGLLLLFIQKSITQYLGQSILGEPDGMMLTCRELDTSMVALLNRLVKQLHTRIENVRFQSYEESIFYYVKAQPKELWNKEVLICDRSKDKLYVYILKFNFGTTPVVAYTKKEHCYLDQEIVNHPDTLLDPKLLEILQNICNQHWISTVYLLGDGFLEEWIKETLIFLCRQRKVFMGNNLYSKGACFAMKESMPTAPTLVEYIYLGEEKLKFNVGVYGKQRGENTYHALLDGGSRWFEAKNEMDFYLQEDNQFTITITPLNGREVKKLRVTLEDLPMHSKMPRRLKMKIQMTSPRQLELVIAQTGSVEWGLETPKTWLERYEVE